MPNPFIPIEETDLTISRPIHVSIVKDLCTKLGIDPTIPIIYVGEGGQAPVANSTLDKAPPGQTNQAIEGDSRLIIEVEESFDENNDPYSPVYYPTNTYIFNDELVQVNLRPAYNNFKATISVRYKTSSRTDAKRWYSYMRYKAKAQNNVMMYAASYTYFIPVYLQALLAHVWQLRNNREGYGDTLLEWIKANITPNYTVNTNLNASKSVLSIRERQEGIMGRFEFGVAIPKPQQEPAGHYEVGFDYLVTYAKPAYIQAGYPLMIHNQYIHKAFRPELIAPETRVYNIDATLDNKINEQFGNSLLNKVRQMKNGVPYPFNDTWVPSTIKPFMKPMYRFMLQQDPNNPLNAASLQDLGVMKFNRIVLGYMSNNHQYLTQSFNTVFDITLHRWNYLTDQAKLTIDQQLNITFRDGLKSRDWYHLVIDLCVDPSMLSQIAVAGLNADIPFLQIYGYCLGVKGPITSVADLIKQLPNNGQLAHPTPPISPITYLDATIIVNEEKFDAYRDGRSTTAEFSRSR